MARLLVPEDFGLLAMSMAITGFVGMFSDMGLSSATVQRQNLDQDTVSGLFQIGVLVGIGVMLLAFAVAPMAAFMFDEPRVAPLIMVSAMTIPIGALSTQHLALMSRRMEFFNLQKLVLVSLTLSMLVALLLAWQTPMGYWALIANTWVNTILIGVLAWKFSPWRPGRVKSWVGVKESLNFGAFLTGYSFVEYLHRQSDNLLIGWKYDAVALGFYSRAYGLFMLPTTALIYPFFEIAKSVLSRTLDEPGRYRLIFNRMLFPLNFLTCGLAGLLYLLAPVAILLLYGDQWGPSVPLFRALSVCMIVQAMTVSLGWIYITTGRSRAMFYNQALSATVFALGFLAAVHLSLQAVAVAYSAISLAMVLPMVWLAVRNSPFTMGEYLGVHLPIPVAAACSAVFAQLFIGPEGLALWQYVWCTLMFGIGYLTMITLFTFLLKPFRQTAVDLFKITAQYIQNRLSGSAAIK